MSMNIITFRPFYIDTFIYRVGLQANRMLCAGVYVSNLITSFMMVTELRK